MASQGCAQCHGLGLVPRRGYPDRVCNCVLRAIFRACHERFRHCSDREKFVSRVSLEANPGRQRKSFWGMKNEEYIADFVAIAKRTLSELEYKTFSAHFLLGAEWTECVKRGLEPNRGAFFHAIYRIETKLGRAFAECEPYSIWPLDEYFGGARKKEAIHPIFRLDLEAPVARAARKSRRLRAPLKALAA